MLALVRKGPSPSTWIQWRLEVSGGRQGSVGDSGLVVSGFGEVAWVGNGESEVIGCSGAEGCVVGMSVWSGFWVLSW
jgi:hypothetical protein